MAIYDKKNQVKTWGEQFKDRNNSFDDNQEIKIFMETVTKNTELRNYILQFIPNISENCVFEPHPNGQYGVDLGIRDRGNGNKLVMVFDLERWSVWNNDFPSFYKYLSFLSRKNKFLRDDIPFVMVWQNNDCSKYLMVDDTIIRETEPEEVTFKNGFVDQVRKIPLQKGTIFGQTGYRENTYFNLL